jgi:SAM-dependent methyltransferase
MDGWWCVDIGAGDGSVARWLAARVGPHGRVVATDLAVERLSPSSGVERRRFDLVSDDLDSETYDLVHARSVLLHVADPFAALEKMARALRPGGVLLVEDADLTTFAASDPKHPLSVAFNACMGRFSESLKEAGVNITLGPRLPALISRLGLTEVDCAARLLILQGGTPGAALWKRNIANVVVDTQGSEAQAVRDAAILAMDDPTFWFASTLRVQAWGRRR